MRIKRSNACANDPYMEVHTQYTGYHGRLVLQMSTDDAGRPRPRSHQNPGATAPRRQSILAPAHPRGPRSSSPLPLHTPARDRLPNTARLISGRCYYKNSASFFKSTGCASFENGKNQANQPHQRCSNIPECKVLLQFNRVKGDPVGLQVYSRAVARGPSWKGALRMKVRPGGS